MATRQDLERELARDRLDAYKRKRKAGTVTVRDHRQALADETLLGAPRSSEPYTREALEADYRAGRLVRDRQMMRGCVESMIANSLGLPSGEADPDGTRRVERRAFDANGKLLAVGA